MEDDLVTKLAAEPSDEVRKRKEAESQVAVLDRVIATCLNYLPAEKGTTYYDLVPNLPSL